MTVTCRTCINRAADHYGVLPGQILRRSKSPRHIRARQLAQWLAAHCLKLSNGAIGERIGDVTASTVGRSCRAVEALRTDDPVFFQETDILRAQLMGAMKRAGQWVSFDGETVNPLVIAERILKTPTGDLRISINDLKALARFVLAASDGDATTSASIAQRAFDDILEYFEACDVMAISHGTKGEKLAKKRLEKATVQLRARRDHWHGTGCAGKRES